MTLAGPLFGGDSCGDCDHGGDDDDDDDDVADDPHGHGGDGSCGYHCWS